MYIWEGSCRKEISIQEPSADLPPLRTSPKLISCATELRFEYVRVTVFVFVPTFWLWPHTLLRSYTLTLLHSNDFILVYVQTFYFFSRDQLCSLDDDGPACSPQWDAGSPLFLKQTNTDRCRQLNIAEMINVWSIDLSLHQFTDTFYLELIWVSAMKICQNFTPA